jgi:hypothetical protein
VHIERCFAVGALMAIGLASTSVVARATDQAVAASSLIEFKCPDRTTAVHLDNGATITWQGRDGRACRRELTVGTGEKYRQVWFAPTFTGAANASWAFFDQTKPWGLWPLRVGEKMPGRYDGVGSDPGFPGSWVYTTVVEKHETLRTRAGVFDVFVVSRKEEALGASFKSTTREWYAPELGVSVKTAYSDNSGNDNAQEAVSIDR